MVINEIKSDSLRRPEQLIQLQLIDQEKEWVSLSALGIWEGLFIDSVVFERIRRHYREQLFKFRMWMFPQVHVFMWSPAISSVCL